jgi:hypothetical protein
MTKIANILGAERLQQQAQESLVNFRSQLEAVIHAYENSFIYKSRMKKWNKDQAQLKHQRILDADELRRIITPENATTTTALKDGVEKYINYGKYKNAKEDNDNGKRNFTGFGRLSALRTGLNKAIKNFISTSPYTLEDIDGRLELVT